MQNNDFFEVIEDRNIYHCLAGDGDLSEWQSYELRLAELDCHSGVCWHPASYDDRPVPIEPTLAQRMRAIQREVASWFVHADGKYISLRNTEGRLGKQEIQKMVPPMLAEKFPDDPTVLGNADKLTQAVLFGASTDPRSAFGVYSGKTYSLPGNVSRRLYRNGMWDINVWSRPAYRDVMASEDAINQACCFEEMLRFAIPREDERNMLLDWVAWNLQNEGSKPSWAIMLYSESKGTGKSTIAKVLTALFGAHNTATTNGIKPLTQRFSADSLDRKLVVAEEVHISSHSAEGNTLKDLITNTIVSIERKYQPIVTIPQRSCFLFMTNHKPLWLEGGERRYFIIDMDHEGHAQGARNEEFYALAAAVNEKLENPQFVRNLYERFMNRRLAAAFDPKNMRFNENATTIMRELQAISGNETERVLAALLSRYNVSIIPSADFPALISHLKLRNPNSLRNMLSRLGWESRRIRYDGAQHRVWCERSLEIENGRVSHGRLADTYNTLASSNQFTWFDLGYYVHTTWYCLHNETLIRSYRDPDENEWNNASGDFGPFQSSTSHLRLQARTQEELVSRLP